MSEETKLAPAEEPTKPNVAATELVVHDDSEFAMLFDSARFNQAQRVAKLFANSTMVPAHFRGKPADVFIALHLAVRMNLDPFMVMSKAYPIQGRIGLEAQLIIALVNARGPFRGPIQWKFEGEGKTRKCTAYATHEKTGETCELPIDWAMVEAEGWSKKPGSKWLTMPDQMFRYRTATFLSRAYCPEVILGLSTIDELEDMDIIDIQPSPISGESIVSQTNKLKGELEERKRRTRSDKGQPRKTDPPQPPQTTPTTEPQGEGQEGGDKGSDGSQGVSREQRDALTELDEKNPALLLQAWQNSSVDPTKSIQTLTFDEADAILGTVEALKQQ